ncbi:MAG TPA: ArsA-related P-loop ATPase [Thermoleophilaceae bacterium]|nr:ArsA-related P-loop ATPase [Thermoleophilaceae bacterium]
MGALLDKRLIFVTGKGGVGKTTVAAALGLAAARAGRRVLVCEVAAQERLTASFGLPAAGFREVEIETGLHAFSVNPEDAIAEWLRYQLHSRTLAGLLGGSRIFQYLATAAPGLAEMVTIGKVWELAQLERKTPSAAPYDLVIVDAPATGHGIALLRAPQTFAEIARVGPINRQAEIVDGFLREPAATAVVAVALAEEMPVSETLDLERRLQDELGIGLDRVFVNGVLPDRLRTAEAQAVQTAREVGSTGGGQSSSAAASPTARAALDAALAAHRTARAQRAQLARLRRGLSAKATSLPHLLTADVDRDGLERLAAKLEREL